jgi:hypothetical protein
MKAFLESLLKEILTRQAQMYTSLLQTNQKGLYQLEIDIADTKEKNSYL